MSYIRCETDMLYIRCESDMPHMNVGSLLKILISFCLGSVWCFAYCFALVHAPSKHTNYGWRYNSSSHRYLDHSQVRHTGIFKYYVIYKHDLFFASFLIFFYFWLFLTLRIDQLFNFFFISS